jgi:hypothetical protein
MAKKRRAEGEAFSAAGACVTGAAQAAIAPNLPKGKMPISGASFSHRDRPIRVHGGNNTIVVPA